MRKRLRELRDKLANLNLGDTIKRAREARDRRRERIRERRKAREHRDALEARYRALLDEGRDGERMEALFQEVAQARADVEALHTRISEISESLARFARKADRKRGQKLRWEAAITRLKQRIEEKPDPVDTNGAWGGSQSVGEAIVVRIALQFNVWISSRKRSASDPLSISNPGSDHNEANTTAYAWDIATFSGAPIAQALASAFGISGYSTGNYNSYYVYRNGVRYRIQILWAVSGHFNHVHVGIRRA